MIAYVLEDGKVRKKIMKKPEIHEGEILVKMKASGLCGTDMEKICGQYTATTYLGHEVSGIVVESNSKDFKEGDRVFPHVHTPCYECYYCRKHSETMCPMYRSTNIYPGGFAEYFAVPEWNVRKGGVIKLPKCVSFEEGALIEPLSTVIRGLDKLHLEDDDTIFIAGSGSIGLLHLLTLKAKGLSVIVSNPPNYKLEYAKRLGADHIVSTDQNVPEKIKEYTNGRGADVAIVASASHNAIISAIESVRNGGTILLFAVPPRGMRLDYDLSKLFNREISIILTNSADDKDTRKALELIRRRKIRVSSIITHKFKLNEFDTMINEHKTNRSVIKAMIIN
ncbi:alcohol dehydrogenase catalytic domain-containing protein [Acidianus manzaensis]|uniref:Alcohol dehydrogenase n=1 Tax=Acidianus manzaensis TaxID=282676 RepID=A0A1W6K3S9_9CREN|nr:alcohol dehydrogenase catalytic domain-containing protein [Acidianus manzaensis]ARM77084.1 alcohol dehydrogenase [Acidianus manzaensis]